MKDEDLKSLRTLGDVRDPTKKKISEGRRFINQNVQDPDTRTLSHFLQLKQEYQKLVADFNCDIQEFITVQDPPAPDPRRTSSFVSPYKPSFGYFTQYGSTSARESRPVLLPCQRTISRQLMHEVMANLEKYHCHCLKYADD